MPRPKGTIDADGAKRAECQEELKALRAENDRLRKIVARIDYQEALKQVAPPVSTFTPDMPGRVIALASVGMFNHEIRSELGIDRELWKDWAAQIPAFRSALSRARDISTAYWHQIAREAVRDKDWKMPLNNLLRMVQDLSEDDAEEARGDASKLVIYSPGAAQ